MNVEEIAEEIKVGKRLAASQVDQLKQAIKILLDVAGYVNYDDNIERFLQEVQAENEAILIETEKNFDNDFNEICTGFKVLSGQDDDYIVTWTTNSYEDREAETFTLKAITDYVQRNVDNENKGTVQFWHIPGSDFADTIAQMISGKFLVEAHKFRKDDIGTAFKEFFREYSDGHDLIAPEGWGCSHGFVYRKQDRQDGVYEWFDKKETSVLPRNEAANIFTAISI